MAPSTTELNDIMDNQEPTEHSFVKYSVFVSELREHVLSYLDNGTLFNYSQCSKYCDSEIQKYNTKRPSVVIIKESDDGILVRLSYTNVGDSLHYYDNTPRFVDRHFKFSEHEDEMKAVKKYFRQVYRYVKEGKTEKMEFYLKKWPAQVMKIVNSTELNVFEIHMHNSILDELIKFAETGKTIVNNLHLLNKNNDAEIKKEQAKHLFRLKWYQQLSEAVLFLNCEIDDEDFLGLKTDTLFYSLKTRQISNDAIRRKVDQMIDRGVSHTLRMDIQGECDPNFDLNLLFPDAATRNYQRCQECKVGNVYLRVEDCGATIDITTFGNS